ncbi:MAG: dihydroorotase [Dehalococcoidia bacterium]|nr:dihydroorotase [Dehalococcoidia bacterium]
MTTPSSLLIRNGRVIDPSQGLDQRADVLLEDGKVAWVAVSSEKRLATDAQVIDAGGFVVCPGFVDLHCHLREPGFEDKETIASGTLAAARGGFTTVCAMPNTNPAVDSAAIVRWVAQKAQVEGYVRVLPIGCVTKGRNGKELTEMGELAEAGVIGFSDDGSPVADVNLMRTALLYSSFTGLPIIQHCEEPSLARGGMMHEGWVASRLGLKGQPSQAEEVMASRDVGLVQLTHGRLHLAHVSTAGTTAIVRWAKGSGLAVTAEVTPHHLALTDEWVLGMQDKNAVYAPLSLMAYDTNAKVNPPLRTARDIEALVAALKDGTLDAIATDHAPHAATDKECTFNEAAFGISGLETAFGLVMRLVHAGQLPLGLVIEKMTAGPAKVLGEKGRGLGSLKAGAMADVAILDPNAEWVVDRKALASKGKNTPLDGVRLKGSVVATVVGGRVAYMARTLKLTPAGRGAR